MRIPGRRRSVQGPDEQLARTVRASKRLTNLIRAAGAPARPEELAGEQPALEAFNKQRKHLGTGGSPGHHPGRWVLAGGAAVAVLAGTGVAAASGSLPSPLQDAAHNLLHAPAPDRDQPSSHPSSPSTRPTSSSPPTPSSSGPSGSPSLSRSPTGSPSTSSIASSTGSGTTGSGSDTASPTGSGDSTSPAQSASQASSPVRSSATASPSG